MPSATLIGPHLSILCENGCRSERRIGLMTWHVWFIYNICIRPIPVYERLGLDKCGGWIQLSLTCYALKYSWFGGLPPEVKHGEKKHWREDKLFRDGDWHTGNAGTSKALHSLIQCCAKLKRPKWYHTLSLGYTAAFRLLVQDRATCPEATRSSSNVTRVRVCALLNLCSCSVAGLPAWLLCCNGVISGNAERGNQIVVVQSRTF